MVIINGDIMKKEYLIFTILLFITFLDSIAQDMPNDTIVRKDGTKIIDNFKTIIAHNNHLITSKYDISMESIMGTNEKGLKQIAIPLKEIDKVINNHLVKKKRKFLDDDDVIWKSESNNKRNVWVHSRSERKTVILPNGKLKLLHLLVEGKCDLYIDFTISTLGNNSDFNKVNNYYYVHKESELKSTLFKGSGEFIKTKKIDYFDDCPKAKEFIQIHNKLSQLQIIKLVNLYNDNCGENNQLNKKG